MKRLLNRCVFTLLVWAWLWPAPLLAQEDGAALVNAVRIGDIQEVKRLLAAGVDVDGQDEDGATALTVASGFCDTDMVTHLIAAGTEIDRPGRYGDTALMRASWCDSVGVAALLLANGAGVDWQSDFGETALMRASQSGQVATVQLLLEAGARVNRPNDGNFTALMYAISSNQADTMITLLAAGAEFYRPLGTFELSLATDWEVFASLLEAGADPAAAGITPLMIAAFQGDVDQVRALLHADTANDPGPALHYAVFSGEPAILSTLLDAGAEVDCNLFGWTALMHASQRGQTEMVQLLLAAGAAVDEIGGVYTLTALMYAIMEGHAAIVRSLLAAGADPHQRNPAGETALNLASRGQHTRIRALLEAAMQE